MFIVVILFIIVTLDSTITITITVITKHFYNYYNYYCYYKAQVRVSGNKTLEPRAPATQSLKP